MSKEPYIPLTIDRTATKLRVLAGDRELKRYAKRRRVATSTLIRILLDSKSAYPYQSAEKSVFQRTLRKLARDGYLVQIADDQPLDEAA